MNKYDITKRIELFAPIETQEKWDCSGWIVDIPEMPNVNKILFCLTVTDTIVEQARQKHCDMIISHHPLFTVPIKYKNINIYCAHTNLDIAEGGTTDILIEKLGYKKSRDSGFVRFVDLNNPISIEFLKTKLQKISPKLRFVNNQQQKQVKTLAFCAGSGSEFINSTEADVFITGDLKFHTAIDSNKAVFDIGHFESEIHVPTVLKEITKVGEKGIIADEKSPFI